MHRRVFAAAAAMLTLAASAAAQPADDPVRAGYMRYYNGDEEGARAHFDAMHARDAGNLAVWYGLLSVRQELVGTDAAKQSALERDIDQFLAKAEQRYDRSKADAEALFYLANGYLLRARYRVDHDKGLWGAARDAAKSKGYADDYLKTHPEHGDAWLALGLYNYYVDIAPSIVKMLRVLLFLPSGNRVEGLKQIERAARDGNLFAPLADEILMDIYGGYERRVPDAIRIGERLHQRFPDNAGYQLDLAQYYASSGVEAFDKAADQYTSLIARATQASAPTKEQTTAKYRAILGLADLRRGRWRLDEAVALLTPVIDAKVSEPAWILPTFLLRRGNYRALLNDPAAATDAQRVAGDASMSGQRKAADAQLAFIHGRTGQEATVYAELIPGNQLVADRQWDNAKAAYERVGAAHPGDWQVRYRLAFLDFQRGQYDTAARGFDAIAATPTKIPRWLKATALVNLGWTHDIAGRRADAVRLYKKVVDEFEDQGISGAARLGLVTPYKPRAAASF